MSEITGCARVTGVITSDKPSMLSEPQPSINTERRENPMTARVGQKAPDFTAPSYYKGSFTPVKLADFAGKWVLLCFYPGDFTFV
jgi:peroxiredoxin (alkyl hydroperoxide reductase subunit C)